MVQPLEGRGKIYSLGKILCCRCSFGNLTFVVKAKIKKDCSTVECHTKTRPVLRLHRSFVCHWKCIKRKKSKLKQKRGWSKIKLSKASDGCECHLCLWDSELLRQCNIKFSAMQMLLATSFSWPLSSNVCLFPEMKGVRALSKKEACKF